MTRARWGSLHPLQARTAAVSCAALLAACATLAWTQRAAAAEQSCPTPAVAGTECQEGVTPNVQGPGQGPAYTVSKSVSPSGHVAPGTKVTYTVTVTAKAPAPAAAFTDNLDGVLDDATYLDDATATKGTVDGSTPGVVSWAGSLVAGDVVTVTYSVTVNDPDHGRGVLVNDVQVGGGGDCDGCAVSSAVLGDFSVRQSGSAAAGSTLHPGDVVKYTVTAHGGHAPSYAAFTESLESVLRYATYRDDVRASAGTAAVHNGALSWTDPHLSAGETAEISFSVRLGNVAGTHRMTSAVVPTSNDVDSGRCASSSACRVSYRLAGESAPTGSTPPGNTVPPSSSASVVPAGNAGAGNGGGPGAGGGVAAAPGTRTPRVADTGAPAAGLSELAALLLIAGGVTLLLARRPRRVGRHTQPS